MLEILCIFPVRNPRLACHWPYHFRVSNWGNCLPLALPQTGVRIKLNMLSHAFLVIAATLFGPGWPTLCLNTVMGRVEVEVRQIELLTLLSTRLTVSSLADWRKETKKRVSYLSGFTKKLNYWIMWEHNCCHGNRALSMLVISLLHQRFTYGFYLVFGRWHILIPISTLESNKRKHSKVSDEVTDVLNSMFSLVSTTEKVAVL